MKRNLKYFLGGVLLVCGLSMPIQAQESAKGNVKAYIPFDLGELKPEGWIKDWAQKAANGMTKTIGIDFTEFVRGWSDPDQGGWWHYEQTGYYTDGFPRLGFLLDDTLLINRSHQVMEAVIARQKPNGYITSNNKDYIDKWGTVNGDYGQYWSEGIFCRAAIAYYSATKNESVLNMLKKVYANFPVFTYNNQKPFYVATRSPFPNFQGWRTRSNFHASRVTNRLQTAHLRC